MKNHVIVGINGLKDGGERTIGEELAKQGYSAEMIRKGTKEGVFMEATGNEKVTGIIIRMDLETAKPYSVTELEGLCGLRESISVILLLEEKERGGKLVGELFNNGIYNALIGSDASYTNIAELLKRGRTRQAARLYYKTEPLSKMENNLIDNGADTERLKKLSTYLSNEESEDSFEDKASKIYRMLGDRQFSMFVNYLSPEVKEKLGGLEEYSRFVKKDEGKKQVRVSRNVNLPEKVADCSSKRNNSGVQLDKLVEASKKGLSVSSEVIAKVTKSGLDALKEYHKKQSEMSRLKAETVLEMRYAKLFDDGLGTPVKEKEVKKKKRKNEIILPDKMTISISGIGSRTGCSHMAAAFASYAAKKKKEVCIVDFKKVEEDDEIRDGIPVFPKCKIDDLYDEYDYIVLDIGDKGEDRSVLPIIKRSRIKIIMASIDDVHQEKLATFIERNQDNGSDKWVYLFSQITAKKAIKVEELMEDYEHYCIPSFDSDDLSDGAKQIIESIFKGK